MDDIVTGCDSVQDVLELKNGLTELLQKGGFELRKWTSNNKDVLSHLPPESLHTKCLSFDQSGESTLKILRLEWNPANDAFTYSVMPFEQTCTKRNMMLSHLARIYDPLGFLTPVTLISKLLIQSLWAAQLIWDDEPPKNILNRWLNYKQQLQHLSAIHIPRHILMSNYQHIDLCGFSDASLVAYSACVYARIVAEGENKVVLLCAKSKVAPLKRPSVPRLELCGALLLTRLIHFVLECLSSRTTFRNIFAFTDSFTVLHFVANRISLIQEILPTASGSI